MIKVSLIKVHLSPFSPLILQLILAWEVFLHFPFVFCKGDTLVPIQPILRSHSVAQLENQHLVLSSLLSLIHI